MESVDRRSRRGFTILELCFVLAIVSVAATVSIWAYFSSPDVTLAKAANLLVEDLRLTQTRAAYLHVPVEIVFHYDGGGYHIEDLVDSDKPASFVPRRYPSDAIFEGVRIGQKRLSPGDRILFDASGRPTADASVTLRYRGNARTIVVSAQDGSARVIDSQ